MAEEKGNLESLLGRAKEQEKNYDWTSAASTYESLLSVIPQTDLFRLGSVSERLGHALFRAAFQAETNEIFRERLVNGNTHYAKARDLYLEHGKPECEPRTKRCEAMISFMGYWLARDVTEKKRLIVEAWDYAKESMDGLWELKDEVEVGKTHNVLTLTVTLIYAYLGDVREREKLILDALEYAKKASTVKSGDEKDISASLMNAAYYAVITSSDFRDGTERAAFDERAGEYFNRSLQVCDEGGLDVLSANYTAFGFPSTISEERRVQLLNASLEYSKKTRDHYRIGNVMEWAETRFAMNAWVAVDADERYAVAAKALAYANEARQHFSAISFTYPGMVAYWSALPEVGYCSHMAVLESDLERKREHCEKGMNLFVEEMEIANRSAYPDWTIMAIWDGVRIVTNLARTERDPARKRELLAESMDYAKKYIDGWRRLHPYDHYMLDGISILSDIEHELAGLITKPAERRNMIEEAIAHKKESYDGLILDLMQERQSWEYMVLGHHQNDIGNWLLELIEISKDKELMTEAVQAFEKAAEMYGSAGQPSRMAESLWKLAQVLGTLGDHAKSSEKFLKSSEHYGEASRQIPQLKTLFDEYSVYMQAWAEVEKARHHHARQEASAARESYEKASRLHESTKRWKFLAPNYMAWAHVEKGEELSRKEMSSEAIKAFEQAAQLFVDTKESLKKESGVPHSQDEKDNVAKLMRAADLRREYCLGRLALEEAKLLDKQGDEFASCEKFGCAADMFKKLHSGLETDQDRREIQFIMTLSKAWQTMAKAESEASPELYEEAAELFDQAKELSVGERAKLLAMGHNRFCRALAAGTRFADTGDISLHSVATQNLESAAKHYLKAGLESDSEYAKASKLLFDGYVYMDKANKEEDQPKKAKLYAMTEKVLEASSASFAKADYPKKKDQVLKLLEKVKGERELAITLTEVLKAPDIMSSTTAMPFPTSTHESAAGLDRFEHADVQMTVVLSRKDINVGENLNLEIELVNAGKAPAQLTKVEKVIPPGFEVVSKPENYRIEDSYIAMKGRRLDPLKTEEIAIVIKPTVQGHFILKPRILYIDDRGSYASRETEEFEVTVRELGVSGWLRGPEKKR